MPRTSDLEAAMAAALLRVAPAVTTLDVTGSTNDDAKLLARQGAEHLTVVVADAQTAGRGRHGRAWSSAPGASLLASWVVRPSLAVERWSLLPLVAGVACVDAVRSRAGVEVGLKWPNDLLAEERKLGGILVEAEPPSFAVVGVGINMTAQAFPPDLPTEPTSLAGQGAVRLDRADLLAAILHAFEAALDDVPATVDRYRGMCVTLGRQVRVQRAGREPLAGLAVDIDPHGALIVRGDASTETAAAGDVVHVR